MCRKMWRSSRTGAAIDGMDQHALFWKLIAIVTENRLSVCLKTGQTENETFYRPIKAVIKVQIRARQDM